MHGPEILFASPVLFRIDDGIAFFFDSEIRGVDFVWARQVSDQLSFHFDPRQTQHCISRWSSFPETTFPSEEHSSLRCVRNHGPLVAASKTLSFRRYHKSLFVVIHCAQSKQQISLVTKLIRPSQLRTSKSTVHILIKHGRKGSTMPMGCSNIPYLPAGRPHRPSIL